MPDYPIPHLAEKFMSLFAGNPDVYGRSVVTGEVDSEGKHIAKSWLEHKPVSKEVWIDHLEGKNSIGQVPIMANGLINWAAFDIDVYSDKLGIKEILESIQGYKFPIILCRSKSGGAHGYVFFKEPVKAEAVRMKLQEFATFFGQGGCEIFPKQNQLGSSENGDVMYGNWLNMPYDGPNSLRYAMDPKEQAIPASQFVDYAESLKVDLKTFLSYKLVQEEAQDMEDGPPCLNHLWVNKTDLRGGRNTLLFNTAVFEKKRNPNIEAEELRQKMIAWNKRLQTPLEEKELNATLLKSTKRRDYQYQCGNPLLKRHCNSNVCCNCLYGIDGDENAFDPNNKTLIQLRTDPPLFFIDYKKTQLCLTKEEFWSYEKVRQACMVQSLHIPPKMDQEHWLNLVNGYLQSCTIIDVPPEATPKGQMIEYLQHWAKIATGDKERLLNGQPVISRAGSLVFRLKDFKNMLRQHQFKALPDNRIIETLKGVLEGEQRQLRLDNKNLRVWEIPAKHLETPPEIHLKRIEELEGNF